MADTPGNGSTPTAGPALNSLAQYVPSADTVVILVGSRRL